MSADTKDECKAHADSKKIKICQVWSGPDFEEHLRFHAPSVLNRFFHNDPLPDDEAALRKFMLELDPATEKEAGLLVARLFNRPAFQTPIHCESSMPAFRQAIADTIGALNTGIWRDREGAIISRVPPSHVFPNARVSAGLTSCSKMLNTLRITLDEGIRAKAIRRCQCNDPLCKAHVIDPPYPSGSSRSDPMRFGRPLTLSPCWTFNYPDQALALQGRRGRTRYAAGAPVHWRDNCYQDQGPSAPNQSRLGRQPADFGAMVAVAIWPPSNATAIAPIACFNSNLLALTGFAYRFASHRRGRSSVDRPHPLQSSHRQMKKP